MNVGSGSGSNNTEVMAEINTTPLIDVMLVLLIMLIITIPVQLHAVNLNMPTGNPPPPDKPPVVVRIDVDASGTVYWNGEVIPASEVLQTKLQSVAEEADQPEVHLRPHKDVQYEAVASVLAAAQRVGVKKLGVTGNEQFL
ncbi:MAG: biopolymer transporter ExbD [Rhizobacter sp.]